MTDALAQIDWAARDLLDKVDAVLVRHGAPDEHPIWAELRDLGALPIDVYEFLARWEPQSTAPTGTALELIRETLQYQHTALANAAALTDGAWSGAAADAFGARWRDYAEQIADGQTTLDGRVEATIGYLDTVDDWAQRWRTELARTVLACLASAEAVALHDQASAGAAAAEIGVRILRIGASAIDDGYALLAQCRGGHRLTG